MKCNRYHELLMRHFDRDLNNEERELLHFHLESCPDCRNLYGELHRIFHSLETAAPVEPDPGLEKLLLERIKTLPATGLKTVSKPALKTASDEAPGLAKMIYGWLAAALVLLLWAIHLTLQDAGAAGLLLQSRKYLAFLSGIALDSQIICQVVAGVFTKSMLSIFREIQNIYLAAILFGVVLTVRFAAVQLVNPKPDSQ
jgi:predicted anti-sigma-YlaC factor YlaD